MSVPMKNSRVEWLGDVPAHWDVFRFKQSTTSCRNGLWGSEPDGVDNIECVRVADFDRTSLRVDNEIPTLRAVTQSERAGRLLKRGNLLLEKSGGGENQPVGQVVLYDRERQAICSNFVAKVELATGMDPRFWNYQHHAAYAARLNVRSIKQTSGIQNLDQHQYLDEKAAFPPPSEQTAIADHLDHATTRIDALVAKKTRFIELLREKRETLVTHAVTKGLDAGLPMKDSGVDWLGKVPAHWDIVPPTALFTESRKRARTGDQILSATQKYGVIPLAEFEALQRRQVTKASANLEMRKHVEVGDFVISMRSMDGGLERAHAVGSVRSSYSVLKAGPDVDGCFFGLLMKCSLYIQALRLTSNFIRDGQDLSFSHVRKVRLPKPGLAEQSAIADYIKAVATRIDSLIAKTDRSIELLREHRTALITAAVTGKVDLRNTA